MKLDEFQSKSHKPNECLHLIVSLLALSTAKSFSTQQADIMGKYIIISQLKEKYSCRKYEVISWSSCHIYKEQMQQYSWYLSSSCLQVMVIYTDRNANSVYRQGCYYIEQNMTWIAKVISYILRTTGFSFFHSNMEPGIVYHQYFECD